MNIDEIEELLLEGFSAVPQSAPVSSEAPKRKAPSTLEPAAKKTTQKSQTELIRSGIDKSSPAYYSMRARNNMATSKCRKKAREMIIQYEAMEAQTKAQQSVIEDLRAEVVSLRSQIAQDKPAKPKPAKSQSDQSESQSDQSESYNLPGDAVIVPITQAQTLPDCAAYMISKQRSGRFKHPLSGHPQAMIFSNNDKTKTLFELLLKTGYRIWALPVTPVLTHNLDILISIAQIDVWEDD